jgi:hypothetical protein
MRRMDSTVLTGTYLSKSASAKIGPEETTKQVEDKLTEYRRQGTK